MLKWISFFLLLFVAFETCAADSIKTEGDCSPVVLENAAQINIRCFVDKEPLDWLIRAGKAKKIIQGIEAGLPPTTVFQSLAQGGPRDFAGVQFFKNVPGEELVEFLEVLGEHINLNNRIYFTDDAFTSVFWLAAKAGTKQHLATIAEFGLSVHAPDHHSGGNIKYMELSEFFPILNLLKSGSLTISDTNELDALLSNSFVFPPETKEWEVWDSFKKSIRLKERVYKNTPGGQAENSSI